MPATINTEDTTNKDWDPGLLAAVSIGGGGAIGVVGGGVTGGIIGGAAIGFATGGIGLLVGGAVGGIVTLSIWLSQKPPKYTVPQLNKIKKNEAKLIELEQQPIIIAQAVLSDVSNHINAALTQTDEQNTRIDAVVHTLSDIVINAYDTTATLSNVTQSMHIAAVDAVNNVRAMESELHHVRKKFEEVSMALQKTQKSLSETDEQLRETRHKLSGTQEQLATTTSAAHNQLTHLMNKRQFIDDALKQIESGSVQAAEIELMKKQINKLSTKNESLSEIVNTLSHKLMLVIEDNKALKAENSSLKRIFTLFSPKLKKGASTSSNTASSNENAYQPSMFRDRSKTN